MASFLSGSLISLSSIYLFYLNKNNYERKNNFLNTIRMETKIIKNKKDLQNILEFTPILISSKIIPNREIFDNNLNIYFEAPVVFREVMMFQEKEKEKEKEKKEVSDTQSENKYISDTPKDISHTTKTKSTAIRNPRELIWSQNYQKGRNNPHFPFSSAYLYPDKIWVGPFEFDLNFIKENIKVDKKYILAQRQCDYIPIPWMFSDLLAPKDSGKIKLSSLSDTHSFWDEKYKVLLNGELSIISKRGVSVGDIKVNYFVPSNEDLTILGAKQGNTVAPYENKDGSIFYVKNKRVPFDQIISELENSNSNWYWAKHILIGIMLMGGIGLSVNGLFSNKQSGNKEN